jgi:hypothetical protein
LVKTLPWSAAKTGQGIFRRAESAQGDFGSHRHSRPKLNGRAAGDNGPAARYSRSMDWLAIIRDLGLACAIALLIAIAGNYMAALL